MTNPGDKIPNPAPNAKDSALDGPNPSSGQLGAGHAADRLTSHVPDLFTEATTFERVAFDVVFQRLFEQMKDRWAAGKLAQEMHRYLQLPARPSDKIGATPITGSELGAALPQIVESYRGIVGDSLGTAFSSAASPDIIAKTHDHFLQDNRKLITQIFTALAGDADGGRLWLSYLANRTPQTPGASGLS